MNQFLPLLSNGQPFLRVIIIFALWDAIWKGIALWKAGRNNQIGWYLSILIINSVGILPIIYLAFFQRKPSSTT